MPVGACDHCHHLFIIENERSPQRTCPRCLRPMRIATNEEALNHLHQMEGRPRSQSPADELDIRGLSGAPLGASDLGQRVLEVMAEAAAVRCESEARIQEARELRRNLAQTRRAAQAGLSVRAQPRPEECENERLVELSENEPAGGQPPQGTGEAGLRAGEDRP